MIVRWTTFANNVSATISSEFPDISPKFWGAAFAGSSHSTTGFSPQAIFAEGVLTSPAGKLISTYAIYLMKTLRLELIRQTLAVYPSITIAVLSVPETVACYKI